MPTVSAGASQTISIAAGSAYKVSIADGGDAYVDLLSGAPGSPYSSPRLRAPKSFEVFGPYPAAAQIRVRSITGTTEYSEYTAPAPVTYDAAAQKLLANGQEVGAVSNDGNSGDGVVPSYLGQVANGCHGHNGFTGSNKQFMSRTRHVLVQSGAGLQVNYANWYVNASNAEAGSGASMILNVALEKGGLNLGEFKWGGSNGVTIANGAESGDSDVFPVSYEAGDVIYLRPYYTNTAGIIYEDLAATGGNYPILDTANGEGLRVGASGVTNEVAGVGPLVGAGGVEVTTARFSPIAIVAATTRRTVLAAGDSLWTGIHEAYFGTSGNKGIASKIVGNTFGHIKVAKGGERGAQFNASSTLRTALKRYVTNVWCDYGHNDMATGGLTGTTALAMAKTVAGKFTDKVYTHFTVMPRTTSTDSWATVANQSLTATTSARFLDFNTQVRATTTADFSGGYCDLARAVDPADTGLWTVGMPTAANLLLTDGVHPENALTSQILASGAVVALKASLLR